MSFRDDAWRDSYDDWKLATPPEYEEELSEEGQLEEDMWREGFPREESDRIMAEYRAERARREQEAEADLNGGLSDLGNTIVDLDEEIKF